MKNTKVSSIVCFTILVLPVWLDEEYWSFQYSMFYNTSITSIVGWRILELPVLCIDQRFWYSSIVNARYWYFQYCEYNTSIAAGCFILSTRFTFFVFTSFVFMKILHDSTTSIINYVPTTICITHYISQTNYLAKTCACMKMIRERKYSHVIRGSLSCPGSVFDLIGNLCSFPLKCVDW